MARIQSGIKGKTFEREIAHIFSEQWGGTFNRTPSSGAIGTCFRKNKSEIRSDAQEILGSDIICPPEFPYSIECKFYKDFSFHSILEGKNAKLDEWTEQCLRSSIPAKKKMLLIVKINRKITMVCIKALEHPSEIVDSFDNYYFYKNTYLIVSLEDFLTKIINTIKKAE